MRKYTDEVMRLLAAQQKFNTLGRGQEDAQRAFAAVRKTVGDIKGIRLDETTEDITALTHTFRDLNTAVALLPTASTASAWRHCSGETSPSRRWTTW
jgi:hypothetical protein